MKQIVHNTMKNILNLRTVFFNGLLAVFCFLSRYRTCVYSGRRRDLVLPWKNWYYYNNWFKKLSLNFCSCTKKSAVRVHLNMGRILLENNSYDLLSLIGRAKFESKISDCQKSNIILYWPNVNIVRMYTSYSIGQLPSHR